MAQIENLGRATRGLVGHWAKGKAARSGAAKPRLQAVAQQARLSNRGWDWAPPRKRAAAKMGIYKVRRAFVARRAEQELDHERLATAFKTSTW